MRIKIQGTFNNFSSLAQINQSLALHLSQNHNVTVEDVGWKSKVCYNDDIIAPQIEALTNTSSHSVAVEIRQNYPPRWHWPTHAETKIIYIQPWEYSRVPLEWIGKFETFADHVIVYSEWNRQTYINAGLDPDKVSVVRPGVDRGIFDIDEPLQPIPHLGDGMKFLFVGSWQKRKGFDILLKAWKEAFNNTDNVSLIIKDNSEIYGPSPIPGMLEEANADGNLARVFHIDQNLKLKQMSSIFANCDILVHPYRGEGFGLHIQEAMVMGCVPMVSNGGPASEFVDDRSGFLIPGKWFITDIDPVNSRAYFVGKPGDSYSNMGTWFEIFEPDQEQLVKMLQNVYRNPQSVMERKQVAQIPDVQKFVHDIDTVINRVCQRRRTQRSVYKVA